MLASTPVGLLQEAQQRRPSPRPSSREASPRRDSFQPIDPRRDSLAASSGGVQVKPLFEKGGFKGGGGSGAGNSPRQDSPRADSSRSYLNNYWDNFSSNNGQRQVAIG